ncbi:glycosyl transferase family 39 [Nocardia sp. ET3-3]|uniref:Glycosyl transferase family 39 n=1 Tax=Nocardia terrae TaxID=2675851 RepID=A0A7K1V873_9NOCA|nr:glycosyl transferase family 39 [Nocardia terrae]
MVADSVRSSSGTDRREPFAVVAVAVVAAVTAVVAAAAATRYGYYYDELYFIAAGRRPSFGYVDQGPFVPLVARAMDWVFPGSFVALRIPAVAASVGVVVFGAVIARELGGGRGAQVVTAAACATSVLVLGQATTLSTNGIDTVLWVVLTWLLVRWVRTRQDGLLLAAGVVTAVDVQVKWLVPVFWIAVIIGAGVVGPRDLLRRPALWWGAGIALLAATPGLIWQARHGWPQLSMGSVVRRQTGGFAGSLWFVPSTLELWGLLGAVVVVCGVWQLLRSPGFRPYRFLGVAFLLVIAVFAVSGGRTVYGAGCYPVVIAAGSVGLAASARRWPAMAAIPAVVVSALAVVYFATPWRPASQFSPSSDRAVTLGPSVYSELGWSELDAVTVDAYRRLWPRQRPTAVIVTEWYVQAAALDHDRTNLPPVFSPNRGFGYFGAPPDTAETIIYVGGTEADLSHWFTSVVPAGRMENPLGIPGITRDITIWECGGPKQPWSVMWPTMRKL